MNLEAVLMGLFTHLQAQLTDRIFNGFAHLQRMRRLREVYVGDPFAFSHEDEKLDWQRINNVQNMWKGPYYDERRFQLKDYIPGFSATEMQVYKDWTYPTRVNVVPVPLDFNYARMKNYYSHFLDDAQDLYSQVNNEVKLIWVDLTYTRIVDKRARWVKQMGNDGELSTVLAFKVHLTLSSQKVVNRRYLWASFP